MYKNAGIEGFDFMDNAKDSMKKMLSTPHIAATTKPSSTTAVGSLTNEYIQLNREILEEEKMKAKQEEHEPT